MTQKYNQIVVLVHPLWDLLQKSLVITGNYNKPRSDLTISELKERDAFDFQLKHSLQAYGEEIIKHSKDPNTFFIMYLPESISLSQTKSDAARDRLLKRFSVFCKKQFKGRNIITFSPNFEIDFPESLKKRLNRELRLIVFGEYGNACVNGATAVLKKSLKKSNHEVYSKIVSEKTLFWEYNPLLKKGKLNLRVEPINTRRELDLYRTEKREKGKLPLRSKKLV